MEIGKVLNRLEKSFPQEKRPNKIKNLLIQFSDNNHVQQARNQIVIKEAIYDFDRFGKEEIVGHIAKEKLQDVLTAYLFSLNRQIYLQEGGQNYDYEKESRQIKAVVHALEGKHIHMGTGEGKSSTILPILSLVEALTSEKTSALVSTISNTLLVDIFKKTEKLASLLPILNERFNVDLEIFNKPISKEYIDDSLFEKMQKEALLNGSFSEKTQKEVAQKYWQDYCSRQKTITGIQPADKPKISFISERNLIFEMSQDQDSFLKNCPRIFMDEADVAYNRKTPYIKTRKDRFVTPEEVQNFTYQWLFNYIVAKQITMQDFEIFQGRYLLKEGLIKNKNLQFNTDNPFFNGGLEIIAKKLNLSSDQKEQLVKKTDEYFKKNKPNEDNLLPYFQAVGDILAEMSHKKNRDYLIGENQLPTVRDSYIDELLEEHENQPEYQLAILALNDQFDFIHLNQAIRSAVSFPTFVAFVKDRLVCFSATLFYQKLKGGNLTPSGFSKFLQDITLKKVALVSPPEKKIPPIPDLTRSTKEAEKNCIDFVHKHQNPLLVIDYEGVDHTKRLYQEIKKTNKKVVLLPPKPSLSDQEIKYNQYLSKITRQLAEGEIEVIVSSGSAGMGVNIVKDNGNFPDLSVCHFGLPIHEALISQGNGRRRAPGNSFGWFLSQELLEPFFSYFPEEKVDKLSIALGEIDQIKIREMSDKALDNPEKRLPFIEEILKQKQRIDAQNTKTTIEYDLFFQKLAEKFQKNLSQLIADYLPEEDPTMIKNYTNLIGIPQSLYYETTQHQLVVPGAGSYITNLKTLIFQGKDNWYEKQLELWFEMNKQKIDYYHQIIFSFLKERFSFQKLNSDQSYRILVVKKPNSDED